MKLPTNLMTTKRIRLIECKNAVKPFALNAINLLNSKHARRITTKAVQPILNVIEQMRCQIHLPHLLRRLCNITSLIGLLQCKLQSLKVFQQVNLPTSAITIHRNKVSGVTEGHLLIQCSFRATTGIETLFNCT